MTLYSLYFIYNNYIVILIYTYLYIKKLKIKNYISSSNKCISCAFSIQQCVLLENKPSVSPTLTGGFIPPAKCWYAIRIPNFLKDSNGFI